jgi:hypothetical protein
VTEIDIPCFVNADAEADQSWAGFDNPVDSEFGASLDAKRLQTRRRRGI